MSKEIWCTAHENLYRELQREPTEDEIIAHISFQSDAIYQQIKEERQYVVPKVQEQQSLHRG